MGLLSTLAKHRADEQEALRLKDRITRLEDTTSEDDKKKTAYLDKIDKLSNDYSKRMNHSRIPLKVADDIHKLRSSRRCARKGGTKE